MARKAALSSCRGGSVIPGQCVPVINTGHQQQSLGYRNRDNASASGDRDETHQHRTTLARYLAWNSYGLANLVAPVGSLCKNDSKGFILAALNTVINMTIVVPNTDKNLELGLLAGQVWFCTGSLYNLTL